MEDYITREIDRIGELLRHVALKLGLLNGDMPDYSLADVKDEFEKSCCPIDLDTVLRQENPVWYLVKEVGLTDSSLETMIDIIFHSDLDEGRKNDLLQDALTYLDGRGYFSFHLHSFCND